MRNESTIDAREAAHFGKLAADWWDPSGSSAMLHKLNPPRLGYIRARIDAHWGGDPGGVKTVGRLYWSAKSQTVISDTPSEARIAPALWGDLYFTEPDKAMHFGPDTGATVLEGP